MQKFIDTVKRYWKFLAGAISVIIAAIFVNRLKKIGVDNDPIYSHEDKPAEVLLKNHKEVYKEAKNKIEVYVRDQSRIDLIDDVNSRKG